MVGPDESGRISTSGIVRQDLGCSNHSSVWKYKGVVPRKAISDVTFSRAMVFEVEEAERT